MASWFARGDQGAGQMPVCLDPCPCLVVPVPVPDLDLDPARARGDAVTAARVRVHVPIGAVEAVFRPLMTKRLPLWWTGAVVLGHAAARDVVHRMGEGARLGVVVGRRAEVQS
jgi:hypothetical protein